MNKTRRVLTTIAALLVSGVVLTACGTAKTPTYQGGGNGGAQSTTPGSPLRSSTTSTTTPPSRSSTTTTTPPRPSSSLPSTAPWSSSRPIGSPNSPQWVAAQYVAINWSLNPTWPDLNYAYTLTRPYLTPAMNAYYARQAAHPLPTPVVAKWKQEVRFKAGSYALVTAAFIVTDASVTPTTCVVNVDFLLGTTQNGARQGTAGSTIVDAFRMQKIGGTWYVASAALLPQ